MDTQVRHMSTVKFKVPYDLVQDLRKDLRRWQIRHYPFRRQEGGMEVEMYQNPKVDFILLKYSY
jgi:hypothetical protein